METNTPPTLAVTAVKGAAWTYVAFSSGKLIVFLTTVILARLLSKSDFGVVGYAVTVIGFLDVVKDLGVGAALIYHRDEKAVPTAFWLGLATNTLFCLTAWIGAPLVGDFFNDDRAVWVTRILALNFPLGALGAIHETLLVKQLAFNQKFIPDFSRSIAKGAISMTLAFSGFGPWSIILGQLGGVAVSTIVLWKMVDLKPLTSFSFDASRKLFEFGIPLVGMNIVSVFVLNVDYLLVGRYLGAEALGVYTLAFRVPEMTVLQLCNIVAQVIFPLFAKIRDDADALARGFLQTARYVSLITVPAGVGMALLAEPFVLVVLGEKWLEVADVMRAIFIYTVLLSLGYNAGDVYKAQGKPWILTRISVLQALLLTPTLFWAVTVRGSVAAVGWAQAALAFVGTVVYLSVAMRMLKIPLLKILSAFKEAAIGVSVMTVVLASMLQIFPDWTPSAKLIVGIFVGILSYVGALRLFQPAIVNEILGLAGSLLGGRKETEGGGA